jgi:PAS domain S-box-containing protein
MKDTDKAKEQLIKELTESRRAVVELTKVVTETKRVAERYRLLSDNAADVIWTVGMDMRITYISPSITRLLGYTVEEAKAKAMEEVFTPSSFEYAMKVLTEELAIEKMKWKDPSRSRILEYELIRKDGSVVPVEVNCKFIRDSGEQPVAIMVIARDITERRQAEESMRETDALKEVDRQRSELLTNAFHELRTPLATIKGYSTMLLNYDTKMRANEKRQYLYIIDKASQRLEGMIAMLLDFCHLETGQMEMKKETTSIYRIIREAIVEAQGRAIQHKLTANLPKGLSEVRINGKRIRQVLDNLINNAIKYSDEGTEVVVLAQLEKSELCISVRDQGWGIAPEELEEVFNRMYRARGKSAREENGMGLGLAICKGIGEAHGGRIWLLMMMLACCA